LTAFERPARPSISVFLSVLLLLCAEQTRVSKQQPISDYIVAKYFRTVAKIDAVQAEYSAFETLHETDGLIKTARELGVAYVAYSPLGHGWLVDDFPYKTPDDFAPDDFRRTGKFFGFVV
jgi:aryl-alcohol dehydrogenase-like predicted oxidoreductase